MLHIAPLFLPQASKFQKRVTIWITSLMKSSSSSKQQFGAKNQDTGEKQMKAEEKLTQITENLKVLTALMMNHDNHNI